ncbi:hypothetical protein D3C80_1805630 [compost metagenome]
MALSILRTHLTRLDFTCLEVLPTKLLGTLVSVLQVFLSHKDGANHEEARAPNLGCV